MKSRFPTKGALDLIEEAVFLLRRLPAPILSFYFIGTAPFILVFLYFWSDMSRSPFAHQHLGEAGFLVAITYLWMKCWQSVFSFRLRAFLAGNSPEPFSFQRIFRLLVQQTILQPYALILLPFALLIYIPFPALYAFYHNVSLYGDGTMADIRMIRKKAWGVANLWTGQNHVLVALLGLMGMVIYLNWIILLLVLPHLLKMLFGLESIFTLSGVYLAHTTFFMVTGGVAYLFIGILNKTVYILRAFYGESLETGADLIATLKLAAETN